MRNDNKFAADLMGQEGLVPGRLSETERKEIRAMLETQWARARRMKWATIASWLIVAACLLVFGISDFGRQGPPPLWIAAGAFATRAFILIAVILTISYYARYRSASMNEMRARLAEIEAKLQQIVDR